MLREIRENGKGKTSQEQWSRKIGYVFTEDRKKEFWLSPKRRVLPDGRTLPFKDYN